MSRTELIAASILLTDIAHNRADIDSLWDAEAVTIFPKDTL